MKQMFFSSKWIIYYIFCFMLFPLLSGILMICQEFLLHVVNKNNLLAKRDPQRLPTRGVLWGQSLGRLSGVFPSSQKQVQYWMFPLSIRKIQRPRAALLEREGPKDVTRHQRCKNWKIPGTHLLRFPRNSFCSQEYHLVCIYHLFEQSGSFNKPWLQCHASCSQERQQSVVTVMGSGAKLPGLPSWLCACQLCSLGHTDISVFHFSTCVNWE